MDSCDGESSIEHLEELVDSTRVWSSGSSLMNGAHVRGSHSKGEKEFS